MNNTLRALGLSAALMGCATTGKPKATSIEDHRVRDRFATIESALKELPLDKTYRWKCSEVRAKLASVLAGMGGKKKAVRVLCDGGAPMQMDPCPEFFDLGDGVEIETFVGDIREQTNQGVRQFHLYPGTTENDKTVSVSVAVKTGESTGASLNWGGLCVE